MFHTASSYPWFVFRSPPQSLLISFLFLGCYHSLTNLMVRKRRRGGQIGERNVKFHDVVRPESARRPPRIQEKGSAGFLARFFFLLEKRRGTGRIRTDRLVKRIRIYTLNVLCSHEEDCPLCFSVLISSRVPFFFLSAVSSKCPRTLKRA